MIDIALSLAALLYATFLMWAGMTAIRFMAPMVIAPRPALYVNMRLTAIWSVGLTAIACGLTLAVDAISRGS